MKINYLKNYKRLFSCLIFVFCWILKVLTKAIHMGNKTTIHITEFKSCHQVAKLKAESSKQMQELRKHKYHFFSFMQGPDKAQMTQQFLYQDRLLPRSPPGISSGYTSPGAALPIQRCCCLPGPGITWVSAQGHRSALPDSRQH